jgi:WD40 repeat protein
MRKIKSFGFLLFGVLLCFTSARAQSLNTDWQRSGHAGAVNTLVALEDDSRILSISGRWIYDRLLITDSKSEALHTSWEGLSSSLDEIDHWERYTTPILLKAAAPKHSPVIALAYALIRDYDQMGCHSEDMLDTDYVLIQWRYTEHRIDSISYFDHPITALGFSGESDVIVSTADSIWSVNITSTNRTPLLAGERLLALIDGPIVVTASQDAIHTYKLSDLTKPFESIPVATAGINSAVACYNAEAIAFAVGREIFLFDRTSQALASTTVQKNIVTLASNGDMLRVVAANGELSSFGKPGLTPIQHRQISDASALISVDDGFVIGTGRGSILRSGAAVHDTIAHAFREIQIPGEPNVQLIGDELYSLSDSLLRVVDRNGVTISEQFLPFSGIFSPRGTYIATYDGESFKLKVYNRKTLALVREFHDEDWESFVNVHDFSPSESRIVLSINGNSSIYVANILDGSIFETEHERFSAAIYHAKFINEDSIALATSGSLLFLNIANRYSTTLYDSTTSSSRGIDYSPKLRTIAFATLGQIHLYSLDTKSMQTYDPPGLRKYSVLSCKFTRDGSALMISNDSSIGLLDLNTMYWRIPYHTTAKHVIVVGQFSDGSPVSIGGAFTKWNAERELRVEDERATEAASIVYPNPASTELHIDGNEGEYYSIVDQVGRTCAKGIVIAGCIDLSRLAPGTYTLVMTSRAAIPFVKEK